MLFVETPPNPILAITDLRAAPTSRTSTTAPGRRQYLRESLQTSGPSTAAPICHPQHDQVPNGHSDSIGGVVIAVETMTSSG